MKKNIYFIFSILLLLLCLTLFGCNKSPTGGSEQIDEDKILSAVEVYEKVNPSVACIFSLDIDGNYSSGSGFFIDNNGTLVTNYHVIKDAIAIVISMYDNEKDSSGNWYKATSALGMNKDLDIAILQTNKTNSVPVTFDFSDVSVGEKVYAIGYPESFTLGWEESTFSQGMITKKSMEIDGQSYIQSDVNITHGNSGGVLINEKGKVIGITSAGLRFNGIDYMNLSIPIEKYTYLSKYLYLPIEEIPFYYLTFEHTFYVNGELYDSYSYSYGTQGKTPREPSKIGYTFLGWKDSTTNIVSKNISYAVTRTKRFDAQYKANEYEITLDVFDGDPLDSDIVTIEYDEKKTLLVPTRKWYVFMGWYEDIHTSDYQITTEDGQMINKWQNTYDTRLYAKWAKEKYTIACVKNNDEAGYVFPCEVRYEETAVLCALTNTGYTWVGWYCDDVLLTNNDMYEFVFTNSTDPTKVYEARWFKVTLVKNVAVAGDITTLNGKYRAGQHVTITATTNTSNGYTWLGWYKGDMLWSSDATFELDMPSSDETFEARWTCYTLTTTRNDTNAGTVTGYNNTKVTAGTNITLNATTKSGYTWLGWYKNNVFVTDATSYSFSMPKTNETYEARWTYYTLSTTRNNSYAGTITGYNNVKVTAGTSITLTATINEGYVWLGWYNGNSLLTDELSYTFNMPSNNIRYDAKWTYYTLKTSKNNEKAGTITSHNNTKITPGTSITITASTNEGYTWLGWYNGNSLLTEELDYTFDMPSESLTYTASWSTNTYNVSINNHADGVTISGDGDYLYDTLVTLSAIGVPDGQTISWRINEQVVYDGNTYSFNMGLDVTIDTYIRPFEKESTYIYFGSYPQTKVTDNSIKSALNSQAGVKPTSSNSYSWTDYGYYISGSVQSYMWYQDITYGGEKYRGVYFTSYRPAATTLASKDGNTSQDENGYNTSNIYWFKYEPIKWEILKEENGKALLIADLLLDAQDYYWSSNSSSHSHNGAQGYSNNYKLSHIRQWLNDTFYEVAFNDEEQEIIETTCVFDNYGGTYSCNPTNDKIFLLSLSEANLYYSSNDDRKFQGTDYAKVQGLLERDGASNWWLRSPNNNNSTYALNVGYNGIIYFDGLVYYVCGVRPAIWINL